MTRREKEALLEEMARRYAASCFNAEKGLPLFRRMLNSYERVCGHDPDDLNILHLEGNIRDISEDLRCTAEIIKQFEKAVQQLHDSRLRDLLIMRYFKGLTWGEVAEALGYGERQTYVLRGRAIDSVDLTDIEQLMIHAQEGRKGRTHEILHYT